MFEKIKKEEIKAEDRVIRDIQELIESERETQKVLNEIYKMAAKGEVKVHHKIKDDKVAEKYITLPDGEVLFYENHEAIEAWLKEYKEKIKDKMH